MGNNVHGNLKRKRKKSSQDLKEVVDPVPNSIMDYYDKRDEEIGPVRKDFLGEESLIEEYYRGKIHENTCM